MLLESGGESDGIPHTVQAMISARIDRLPETERTVLRRAAVAGRMFWSGAIEELGDSPIKGGELHDLVERDFLVREPRSTIRGEEAYRFKHVLIRDVAYAGLSKSSRALLHRQMAQWLAGRPVADELVEIRAYPPRRGRRSSPRSSRGAFPRSSRPRRPLPSSRRAGGRSRARRTASRGGCSRAPSSSSRTLERRYLAARAAWRMSDFPTVSAEMHEVSEAAQQRGRSPRRGPGADRARAGVAVTATPTTPVRASSPAGRSTSSSRTTTWGGSTRSRCSARSAYWEGDLEEVERLATERLAIAERIGRTDLQSGVLLELNDVYNARLETERAHEPLARAIELAGDERQPDDAGLDPAGVRPAGGARGPARRRRGRARGGASDLHRERRGADARANAELARGRRSGSRRDLHGAEEILREAIRAPEADRGPGNAGREPAPAGAGAARPGAPRRGGALRPRGARDRRRRGCLVGLDDAACARARPGRAGAGRRGRAAAAGGRGDPAADRVPAPPDRAARGARRVPPRARPRRRGGRGRGGARRARLGSGRGSVATPS